MELTSLPPWLKVLLSITTFFWECEVHTEEIRRECNMYCLDCNSTALCFNCIQSCHKGHRSIQIRRSSYHNAVRAADIQNDLDISGIQTYVINSSDVVFLNKRDCDNPKTKRAGRSYKHTSRCQTCRRNISDSFTSCSLGCKFVWEKKSESESGSGSTVLSTNKSEGKRKMEEEEITKRLPSQEDKHLRKRNPKRQCRSKNSANFQPTPVSNSNKRKGIPRRAPFY